MSSNDDLLLIGSLDQPLPVDESQVNEMANRIDEKIQQSIQDKNVYIALNVAKQLIIAGQLVSWGLARILYQLELNWDKFGITEDFDEVVWDYIGKHKHTVERYVKVEKMFIEGSVPEEFQEELKQRNIGDMFPIANAVAQGYEIKQEQWQDLVDAPDYSTVAKIVREDIKGAEPRKGALQLSLDREGTIWAIQSNHHYFVGSLECNSDEDVILKAIDRIISNSGIMRQ